MAAMVMVSAETLTRQITSVFSRWGIDAGAAAAAAKVMVETDLSGVDSHGIGMLPYYQQLFAAGKLDPRAEPKLVRDSGPSALIDAGRALGHLGALMANDLAIAKARQGGIGVVGVSNSNHYGAAGWYARRAAEEGLIGLSLTTSPTPFLVPVFGSERALGTNPIAFSAPGDDPSRPVLLDMATTTVAYGKVTIAQRAGKPLPAGWALDEHGQPELDSSRAHESRRLAPLGGLRETGGHKGYGLALMVEILCAALTGASSERGETAHFFLAIDPGHFAGEDGFRAELMKLTARMRANAPVDPAQPVLVPGDPEHDAMLRRRAEGIPLLPALVEEVRAVCRDSGAAFLLS